MADFSFDFIPSMTVEILEGNKEAEEWHDTLTEVLPYYDITTPERVAGFMAQCGHESRNFSVLSENLNYSASALNRIFPRYFERVGRSAQDYHRQPEKIANRIYGNRMGNGPEESGDGWTYRGGGLIQLTGKNNYTAFTEDVGIRLDQGPDYVRTKQGAIASACWFWDKNNINTYCDNNDIVGMTKRINGGTIGLEDRTKHWLHNLDILGGDRDAPMIVKETIKKGSRGPLVREVQEFLDIQPTDGIFGPGTEEIVKLWQEEHGLYPDGIIGPKTYKIMFEDREN